MRKPLPSCIGLGDDVQPACATLASRGFTLLDDPAAASTERVIVLLSPATAATTLASVGDTLPNTAFVILLTYADVDGHGYDGQIVATMLEACQSLARRRRAVTVVGPSAATLPALVALTCLLDDHALSGANTTSAQSFIQVRGFALRLWLTAKGEVTLVTDDVSDDRMRLALCYYLVRQLTDGLLDPEQPSDSVDVAPLQGLIPAFAKSVSAAGAEPSPDLPLPQPTSALDAQRYEAALDSAYRQARGGLDREYEQWQEQGRRALHGASDGLDDRSPGLLGQLDRLLNEETRRRGLAETRRCVQVVESLFKRLGAGAPPIQIEPRIVALNARRAAQRQLTTGGGTNSDTAMESSRTTSELLKLERAWLLGQATRNFWRECLEHLRRRADAFERLHDSVVALRDTHLPALELCFRDLGIDSRDPGLSRFARAGGLTRAAMERAILPSGAHDVADSAEAIVAAASRLAEGALYRDGRGDGSAGDELFARLDRAKLAVASNPAEVTVEQILFGPGTENDARKLAQRLGMRPRSQAVSHTGLLAWLRLTQGLPLSALLGRLGLQPSGDHIVAKVVPLGHTLVTAAARAEYDNACRELASGSDSKAIAMYRKATSAASVHQDPVAPTLAAVVRVMQSQNVTDFARIDEHISMAAMDSERPERAIIEQASAISSSLRKLQELVQEDTSRIAYMREAEGQCWQTAVMARESLQDPEGSLLAAAFERIGSQLRSLLGDAYGRAEIVIRLLTEKLSYVTQTRVEFKIVNVGQVAANDVRTRIAKLDRLRLLSPAEVVLDQLAPGVESVCGFDVKPLTAGRRAVTVKLSYADPRGRREKTLTADIELTPVRATFQRIELNPFVAGPPIKSAEMFFGRKDVLDFIVNNLGQQQDNLLLLHGPRRTGKSSVLYRLEREPRLDGYIAVYFDLQGQAELTTRSLLTALASRITRALKKRGVDAPIAPRAAELADAPFETFLAFLDEVEDSLTPHYRALVLMDEFELLESKVKQGSLTADIFPFLRSVMQHSNSLSFIMAGTRRLDDMDPAYWAVLYGLVRDRAIGFLDEADARQLITAPLVGLVELDDLAIEAILRLTAGHPYYTQLVCQTIVNEVNRKAERNWVAPGDVAEAAQLVLSLGGGQITHEWTAVAAPMQHLLLAALAELAADAAIWVERDQLFARLQHSGGTLNRQQFEQAISELNKRDLIQTPSAEGVLRFRMDLIRQWVRQEKPMSIVLAAG